MRDDPDDIEIFVLLLTTKLFELAQPDSLLAATLKDSKKVSALGGEVMAVYYYNIPFYYSGFS